MSDWQEIYDLWLDSRNSAKTRENYELAWADLRATCDLPLSEISRIDIARWIAAMRARGLADKSINMRLNSVSSFYGYAGQFIDGVKNPTFGVQRPKNKPKGEAYYLTIDEARAFLAAIPRDTVQGLRDYAMFLAYIVLGRRNSEIRRLRWKDFEQGAGPVYYRWSGKGKSNERNECPAPVWEAITTYLQAAGRLDDVQPDDCVFPGKVPGQPLSLRQVGYLVKLYARRAGLDVQRMHTHSLRHTAAMLRLEAGDNVGDISSFLGHSSIVITQVYLDHLTGRQDKSWGKVAGMLGLDA